MPDLGIGEAIAAIAASVADAAASIGAATAVEGGLDAGLVATGTSLAESASLAGALDVGATVGSEGILAGVGAGATEAAAGAALEGGADAALTTGADAGLAGAVETGGESGFIQSPLASASPGAGDFPSMSLDPTASLPGESPTNALTIGGQTPPNSLDRATSLGTCGTEGAGATPPATPGATPSSVPDLASSYGVHGNSGVGNLNLKAAIDSYAAEPGANPGSFWDKLTPSDKAMVLSMGALTAGQMVTGAAGGVFQGLNAQKQLALAQLINQQNQNQRQYLNANNQYAPTLKFNSVPGPAGAPSPTAPVGIINK